uniref:Uncharacterized protein n=1 Tax=Manihot esculenta TaxID=3983 RepID=A0A2C9WPH8_MANES
MHKVPFNVLNWEMGGAESSSFVCGQEIFRKSKCLYVFVFATNCFKKYGISIEWDFDGVKKGM